MDTDLDHKDEPITRSVLISDIVIGLSDGLIIPFALAAGLSAAVNSTGIIVIAGICLIAAGSIAMGFGGYFTGKTEQNNYHSELKKEHYDVKKIRHHEVEETKEFFANLGLSEELQEQATQEVTKDKNKWVELMTQYELGQEKPDPKRAAKSAMNIALAYAAGGLIPLSPYFFVDDPITGLKFSVVITLLCLFVFGWIKSRITGAPALWGAVRVTLIGALAAAAAFGVAKIFEGS